MELRNPGIPFENSFLENIRINTSGVERYCLALPGRRTVKKKWQVGWLLKMITLIDLTTLSGDDSRGRVKRLCHKALNPVRENLLRDVGYDLTSPLTTAAVCVYHDMIKPAREVLKARLPIAVVSTGFPAGLSASSSKKNEIKESVKAGASEIDVVISRHLVFSQDWKSLYQEIRTYRELCGSAHLKVILGTGDLRTLNNVAKASWVAMMAGADFIKTSTGKESVNATLPVASVMMRSIRDYFSMTGHRVGFKPAGGISNTKTALHMLFLLKEELGMEWITPQLFRFGASSLLGDIERQLFHSAYGRYSAPYYHPLS